MSDMDFAVFRQDFIDSCKSMGEEQGIGFTEAFVNNMAEALVSENLIEGWNNCFFRDNRGMYRIDAYALDENGLGQSVTLIISQDAEELLNPDAATLTRTDAAGIFRKLERFLQKAKEGELDDFREQITGLDDCISTLQDNWKQLNKINLVLFTASPVSLLLKNIDDITYEGVTITHQVWSLERIFEAQQEGNDAIVINFEDYVSGGIRCLEATNAQDAEYHSYLAVMPGTVLAQIFHKYGGRLLEGNVRSFLTTKVAVNRGIRSTIKNEPQKFFAYNNGIAVTATDVVIEQDGAGLLLKSAKNFQIINGGQTTASISNALYKDKWPDEVSKIFVQMKLTALEPGRMTQEQTDLLIKNISEFSNTQNKVNKADFFASHPYHRRMSDLSRTNKAPAVGGKQYCT